MTDRQQAGPNATELLDVADHHRTTPGYTPDDYDLGDRNPAEDIFVAAASELMQHLSDDVQLYAVAVKFGPDDLGPSAEYSGSVFGGDGNPALSSAVAYLVRKHTASGGRPNRGRFYLPGVTEAAVTASGEVDSLQQAAVEADVTSFVNAVIASLATPVLLHGPESPVTTPTPITSFTVDTYVATQRRRQRR